MEKQKPSQNQEGQEKAKESEEQTIEHDVTIMMNEPMKIRLPYGARLSDLLKAANEEYAKKGKNINLQNYSVMLNGKNVSDKGKLSEDPVLIKASVVSLVQKITGGI